jgi:hypothetical protein
MRFPKKPSKLVTINSTDVADNVAQEQQDKAIVLCKGNDLLSQRPLVRWIQSMWFESRPSD